MPTPTATRRHYRATAATALAATVAVRRQWRAMRPEANWQQQWALVGPAITASVATAQREAAASAPDYVAAVLAEMGLTQAGTQAAGTLNPAALAGIASDGRDLMSLLYGAVVHAGERYNEGLSPSAALAQGRKWLTETVETQVFDAARVASEVATVAQAPRTITGYVRMVEPGACARCIVLAGRFYRWSSGFLRHPGCRCIHIPASEDVSHDWRTNPNDYFEHLSREEQDRIFGKSGAEAIRLGADISQVVNARRGMSSTVLHGHKVLVTTEGITSRGVAGHVLGDLVKTPGSRYRRSRNVRLMPETILNEAKDPDDATRLLRQYGYITDADHTSGSTRRDSDSSIRAGGEKAARSTQPEPPQSLGESGGDSDEPPRPPTSSGASQGDDYPRTSTGEQVPFKPSDRPRPSEDDWKRILTKHRHGSTIPGKTTFPASWTDADIRAAVDETLARPDAVDRGGDKFIFTKRIREELVLVQVRVDVNPPIVWTAYPPEGTVVR